MQLRALQKRFHDQVRRQTRRVDVPAAIPHSTNLTLCLHASRVGTLFRRKRKLRLGGQSATIRLMGGGLCGKDSPLSYSRAARRKG